MNKKIYLIDSIIDLNSEIIDRKKIIIDPVLYKKYNQNVSLSKHGTIICGILQKNCPDAIIHQFPVDDNSSVKDIIDILENINYNLEGFLVNISIGFLKLKNDSIKLMENICNTLKKNNIVIVAPLPMNKNILAYPAIFDSVVGVRYVNNGLEKCSSSDIIITPKNALKLSKYPEKKIDSCIATVLVTSFLFNTLNLKGEL